MKLTFGSFNPRFRGALDAVASLAFIAACGTLTWSIIAKPVQAGRTADRATQTTRRAVRPPAEPVSLEGATVRGNRSAHVALIEYSDFQCPYCGKFAREALPTIEEHYVRTGKILIAFRHYPLSIHAEAQRAAEAAECAGRQGHFWEMHDRLFDAPQRLTDEQFASNARGLRLDTTAFDTCMSGQAAAKVKSEAETGKTLGVSSTPTFFIGTVQADGRVRIAQRLAGAQPPQTFALALDTLLETGVTGPPQPKH